MFTIGDFKEIRPGVLKLNGHELYLGDKSRKEPCNRCGGKMKVATRSASGRNSWCKCNSCFGKGQVLAITNVERATPKPNGRFCTTIDVTLDSFLERLNEGVKQGLYADLEDPMFVTLHEWPEAAVAV